MADIYGLAYGALVAIGGLVGYSKAGSIPSLLSGLGFGGLAAFAGYTRNYLLLLGISAILLCVMGSRFYNSGKFMPAGLVALLSLAVLLRSIAQLR